MRIGATRRFEFKLEMPEVRAGRFLEILLGSDGRERIRHRQFPDQERNRCSCQPPDPDPNDHRPVQPII